MNVRALSRFQTDTEAKAVLEGLRDGSVDIVIGTHRLFSSETKFKDLGLVIVDEEQRFGVEHKEQLKKLRANVDVLTMSATPIPRTLEMAVTGIREMSTITTPPEERHPVLTFVGPYEEKQIGAAIRRELLREGQVFYIHNRVESIDRAAARLREIVPEARIATAHGQMSETALEQVVVDFWEKKFDVLVSTTIVESGIDISNANTLIVERGDNFGLSQLHQLRGRVGPRPRARLRLLPLPAGEAAHRDRPRAAGHHRPAHRDGRGHVRGDEGPGDPRRGQPARRRAVRPHRGRRLRPVRPDGRRGRRGLPRGAGDGRRSRRSRRSRSRSSCRSTRTSRTTTRPASGCACRPTARSPPPTREEDIKAVREELADRYGKLPEPVENLLLVAGLRMLARACGVGEIVLQGANIRFAPGGVAGPVSGCASRRTAPSPRASSEDDIRAVREELTDRYGKLPEPVENLLLVAGLRLLARACGVTDITLQGSNIRFGPVELRESQELAPQAALPARRSSSPPPSRSWCPARRPPASAESRWWGGNCWRGPASS